MTMLIEAFTSPVVIILQIDAVLQLTSNPALGSTLYKAHHNTVVWFTSTIQELLLVLCVIASVCGAVSMYVS